MPSPPPVWPRPRLTLGGPPAQVALIAFTDARLPDPLPISRSRHGMPEAASVAATSLSVRARGEHAAWFASFAASGLAAVVDDDLGPDAGARARAAAYAYLIEADADDP